MVCQRTLTDMNKPYRHKKTCIFAGLDILTDVIGWRIGGYGWTRTSDTSIMSAVL